MVLLKFKRMMRMIANYILNLMNWILSLYKRKGMLANIHGLAPTWITIRRGTKKPIRKRIIKIMKSNMDLAVVWKKKKKK